jgi:hypothetical protein
MLRPAMEDDAQLRLVVPEWNADVIGIHRTHFSTMCRSSKNAKRNISQLELNLMISVLNHNHE